MKKRLLITLSIILISIIGYKLYDRYFYPGEFVYIKNQGGAIYHRVDCPLVKKASTNSIVIMSKEQLARGEFRACKTCNPPYDTNYVLEIRKIKAEEERKRLEKEKAEQAKADKVLESIILPREKTQWESGEYVNPYYFEKLKEKGYIPKDTENNATQKTTVGELSIEVFTDEDFEDVQDELKYGVKFD